MLAYRFNPSHPFSTQPLHYSPPSLSSLHDSFNFDNTDFSTALSALETDDDNNTTTQMSQLATDHNPPIRVQQSSPSSHSRVAVHKAMRGSGPRTGATRGNHNVGLLSPINLHQSYPSTNGHTRSSSGSSVTSVVVPASPLDQNVSYSQGPNSADPYSSSSSAPEYMDNYSASQSNFPKSLPTPIDTPVSSTFYDIANPFATQEDAGLSQLALAMRRQGYYEQAAAEDDAGSYQNSVAQSVSSVSHNSPRTPLTALPDDYEDTSKGLMHDFPFQVPMSRSMSGMRDDGLMDSISPTSVPQQKQRQSLSKSGGLLDTHYRTVFNDRLQQVQQSHARSQSPSKPKAGSQSPFRSSSDYVMESTRAYAPQLSPQSRMTDMATSQLRQQQQVGEGVMQQQQPQSIVQAQPKTISPKDAVYEYHQTAEDAAMPLFPPQNVQQYNFSSPLTLQQSMSGQSDQSYGGMTTTGPESTAFSAPDYAYLANQPQGTQGYGFGGLPAVPSNADQAPEFPAQLPSMESSMSERTTSVDNGPQRPVDTSTGSGTYSCTYHGCPHRFESLAKLQRHKRDVHRPTTPSTGAVASRNSQAGPHKCMRINPSTGKPCNSEFSRPYDLTRHEDTIHNGRKMKVRCHLCTEEKTFSRNDALTRHMRVVHPEIDWPGKARRKNARD